MAAGEVTAGRVPALGSLVKIRVVPLHNKINLLQEVQLMTFPVGPNLATAWRYINSSLSSASPRIWLTSCNHSLGFCQSVSLSSDGLSPLLFIYMYIFVPDSVSVSGSDSLCPLFLSFSFCLFLLFLFSHSLSPSLYLSLSPALSVFLISRPLYIPSLLSSLPPEPARDVSPHDVSHALKSFCSYPSSPNGWSHELMTINSYFSTHSIGYRGTSTVM